MESVRDLNFGRLEIEILNHTLNSQAEKVESGWVGGQGELGMCYSVGIDAFRKMLVS